MDTDTDQTSGDTNVVEGDTSGAADTTSVVQDSQTDASKDSESTETQDEGSDTSDSTDSGDEVVDGGQKTKPQSYKSDFKFKVYDEEKEIDPLFRNLIKDAETEKKVKEIHSKAFAFDVLKPKHDKVRSDFQSFQQNTQPIVQYYNVASKMLQGGDLEGLFQLLKIPDEALFKFAVNKAEEANLDPQQRFAIQQQRQQNRERLSLQEQNQNLQSQNHQQVSEYRTQELNWMLSRPDVTNVATAYDQRVNQPGAFRNMVIQKGLAHHAMTNGREDLSAEQAVSEVLKYIGPLIQTPNQPGNSAIPGQQANPNPQALIPQNGAPPIIPKVNGRSTSSPVRKQVRSIDDLKKRRDELSTVRTS